MTYSSSASGNGKTVRKSLELIHHISAMDRPAELYLDASVTQLQNDVQGKDQTHLSIHSGSVGKSNSSPVCTLDMHLPPIPETPDDYLGKKSSSKLLLEPTAGRSLRPTKGQGPVALKIKKEKKKKPVSDGVEDTRGGEVRGCNIPDPEEGNKMQNPSVSICATHANALLSLLG